MMEAPRKTVVSVWGVESPVIAGGALKGAVGIACPGGPGVSRADVGVVDERGNLAVSGSVERGEPCPEGMLVAEFEAIAPEEPGFYEWTVIVGADALRGPARKKLYFSVVPRASRPMELKVIDEKTGRPLSYAAAFFYQEDLEKVAPLRFETGEDGVARGTIVEGAAYSVRVERKSYNEGRIEVAAGSDPAKAEAALVPLAYTSVHAMNL